jgi:DNA sulfur modification protein DndC
MSKSDKTAVNRQQSVFEVRSIAEFYGEVQETYLNDNRPWVIGYSGGKDSTATVQLVWLALSKLPSAKRQKPVYIISSDTFVETPVIVEHINLNLEAMNRAAKEQGLPFAAHKVVPEVKDTFWVNLLGRGYPAPTSRFRWCTERMKIKPADKFILDRVAEFGEVLMVLGARRGESNTRDQVLKSHEIKGSRLRRHTSLPNAFVYSPIEEFTTEDVWTYVIQVKSPWGVDNNRLIGMYKNASSGECPLVVDTSTPSCGNSRFGCWVCTVVEKDHSLESLVDSGEQWMEPLLTFRNELASHRDPAVKRKIRDYKRRDGKIWRNKRTGGVVPGPYKLDVRKELLRKLLVVQEQVRKTGPDPRVDLILREELSEIRRIWRVEEQDWEDSLPKIYGEVTGRVLDWVRDDVTTLSTGDGNLLSQVCRQHEVPSRLVAKLLDLERDMQGMSRRAGIYNKIDQVFREDWLNEQEAASIFETNDESDEVELA